MASKTALVPVVSAPSWLSSLLPLSLRKHRTGLLMQALHKACHTENPLIQVSQVLFFASRSQIFDECIWGSLVLFTDMYEAIPIQEEESLHDGETCRLPATC